MPQTVCYLKRYMFGRKKEDPLVEGETVRQEWILEGNELLVLAPPEFGRDEVFLSQVQASASPLGLRIAESANVEQSAFGRAHGILAVHLLPDTLSETLNAILPIRESRGDGTPYLIIVSRLDALSDLGAWLHNRADSGSLAGIRLIVSDTPDEIVNKLQGKLEPVIETNVVKMPVNPEVQNPTFKYFYAISPSIRQILKQMKELAENGVTRVYLLGGPGAGKTSLAYYYHLCRGQGNFIAVNLTAESTGDKAAMKSLLCGHVTGAIPGSPGSREGALAFARDGVCFLDESHGVTNVVMEVLMEVLDSGQFLPYGASMKRSLECAVIFASNRNWETLRSLVHLDEYARLGATMIHLKDLAVREEDLIAVLATSLSKFSKQCKTWTPPRGLTEEAWRRILSCPWRGNIRALIRVIETACVSYASRGKNSQAVLDEMLIKEGIEIWEPEDSRDRELYVSNR